VVPQPRAGRVPLLRHHPLPLRPAEDAARADEPGAGHPRVRQQVLVPPGKH
jgi:hypothetical protein